MSHPIDADVRLLAALADPVRLDIVRELAVSTETCACDLTDCCAVSQPTVSHHLRVLREAGAVVSERRGSNIYYRLAPDLPDRLGGIASELAPVRARGAAAIVRARGASPAGEDAGSPS